MIRIEVRFFGGQQLFTRRLNPEIERGLPQVTLPDGATVDELLTLLSISLSDGRPLVLVNRRHRRDNAALADGDQVQLMKTVVGG
jgi:molybdopterin converting factor small subunit